MDFRDIIEFFKDMIKYIVVIVVVILINFFVISIQTVVGSSMSPNLNDSNLLLIEKFSYKLKEVKRGDIISANHKTERYIVKRVIGVPGDSLEVRNNVLYINGSPYNEEYLKNIETNDFSLKEVTGYETIPKDHYFVMGDNRGDSLDSRKFGLINKKDIIGRVIFRFWPINKIKLL